jgi:hypothetical protein
MNIVAKPLVKYLTTKILPLTSYFAKLYIIYRFALFRVPRNKIYLQTHYSQISLHKKV